MTDVSFEYDERWAIFKKPSPFTCPPLPSPLQLLAAMNPRVYQFVDPNRGPKCLCNFQATCSRQNLMNVFQILVSTTGSPYTPMLNTDIFVNRYSQTVFLLSLRPFQGLAWCKRGNIRITWYWVWVTIGAVGKKWALKVMILYVCLSYPAWNAHTPC